YEEVEIRKFEGLSSLNPYTNGRGTFTVPVVIFPCGLHHLSLKVFPTFILLDRIKSRGVL
ncbi:MAG: hypothetical protein WCK98_08295, partial [bacterium]